jgi:hypothetical protein
VIGVCDFVVMGEMLDECRLDDKALPALHTLIRSGDVTMADNMPVKLRPLRVFVIAQLAIISPVERNRFVRLQVILFARRRSLALGARPSRPLPLLALRRLLLSHRIVTRVQIRRFAFGVAELLARTGLVRVFPLVGQRLNRHDRIVILANLGVIFLAVRTQLLLAQHAGRLVGRALRCGLTMVNLLASGASLEVVFLLELDLLVAKLTVRGDQHRQRFVRFLATLFVHRVRRRRAEVAATKATGEDVDGALSVLQVPGDVLRALLLAQGRDVFTHHARVSLDRGARVVSFGVLGEIRLVEEARIADAALVDALEVVGEVRRVSGGQYEEFAALLSRTSEPDLFAQVETHFFHVAAEECGVFEHFPALGTHKRSRVFVRSDVRLQRTLRRSHILTNVTTQRLI